MSRIVPGMIWDLDHQTVVQADIATTLAHIVAPSDGDYLIIAKYTNINNDVIASIDITINGRTAYATYKNYTRISVLPTALAKDDNVGLAIRTSTNYVFYRDARYTDIKLIKLS